MSYAFGGRSRLPVISITVTLTLESVGLFLFRSECRGPGAGRYDVGLAANT